MFIYWELDVRLSILYLKPNILPLERFLVSLWSLIPVTSHSLTLWRNGHAPTLHSRCWAFRKCVIEKIQMLFSSQTNFAKIEPRGSYKKIKISKLVLCREGHTSLFCSNPQAPDRLKKQSWPRTQISNNIKSLLLFNFDLVHSKAIK